VEQDPVGANFIGPKYFETVGIHLVEGRQFTDRDGPSARPVAVVDETFVRRFLGRKNPLGSRFTLLGDDSTAFEIVGVVRDVKEHGLLAPAPPMMYLPYEQHAGGDATFFVRTSSGSSDLVPKVRRVLKQIDPSVPLSSVKTLKVQIEESVSGQRVLAQLSTVMGLLALALASVGLYGAFAYRVSRQAKEIGIRMAVGAESGRIVRDMIRHVLLIVFTGLAIGLICLLAAVHFLRSFLYGLAPTDPTSIAGSAAILCIVSLIAVYLPARMAARVEPAIALRNE
jgi:predicted permease